MSKVDAPRHDPVPIGEVAQAPFAVLPDPLELFVRDVRGQLRHRVHAEVTTARMTEASTAQMSSGEGSSHRAGVRKLRVKPS